MSAAAAQTVAVFGPTLAHLPLEFTADAAVEGTSWLHACRCRLCVPKEHIPMASPRFSTVFLALHPFYLLYLCCISHFMQ